MACDQSLEIQMQADDHDEESFVIVLQHGGNDETCKRSIVFYMFVNLD